MRKTLALIAGCGLALSAGAGIASAAMSAEEVQQMISSQLVAHGGPAPQAVECPTGLATDVGASVTCAVTGAGDETRGVTVTVASVGPDGAVNVSMQLARQ